MFRKIFSVIALMACLFSANTSSAKAIVVLSETKTDYVQTEAGYILHFTLEATADELSEIEAKISGISDRVKMETEFISEGKYKVTYTVDHQNQPEYVHKMMMVSGFQVVNYKGSPYGLDKIVEILYSYQEK